MFSSLFSKENRVVLSYRPPSNSFMAKSPPNQNINATSNWKNAILQVMAEQKHKVILYQEFSPSYLDGRRDGQTIFYSPEEITANDLPEAWAAHVKNLLAGKDAGFYKVPTQVFPITCHNYGDERDGEITKVSSEQMIKRTHNEFAEELIFFIEQLFLKNQKNAEFVVNVPYAERGLYLIYDYV